MTHKYKKISILLMFSCFFFLLTLWGCAAGIKETVPSKKTESINENIVHEMSKEEPQVKYEGSLWQDDGPLSELFINPIARRVGDIVTIKIVEKADAANQAGTDTDRKLSLSAALSGSWLDNLTGVNGDVQGNLDRNFAGSGATKRSGILTADITARVTDVLPNGNLRIIGSREVTVNHEKQLITLSGIIRPRDISTNNVIDSSRISDARIVYSGSGVINDSQRPGWMSRIFDWILPF